MTEAIEKPWLASFWDRGSALIVDVIIISIIGFIIGSLFESVFVQLGAWGRLVGFGVSLLYFGIMNSSLYGGQTLGKKLMKIKVVDTHNNSITIGKSLLRYCILGLPFSLNGITIPPEYIQVLGPLVTLLIFGGMFSIVYLFIFNKVTHQSLHDLIVGSFVVNQDVSQQSIGKVSNIHIKFVALVCVIIISASLYIFQTPSNEVFEDMSLVQSTLLKEKNVSAVNISSFSSVNISAEGEKTEGTYLTSTLSLNTNNVDDVALARNFALILVNNYPQALNHDVIYVQLSYGYDIGIASKWSNYTHTFNPIELQASK